MQIIQIFRLVVEKFISIVNNIDIFQLSSEPCLEDDPILVAQASELWRGKIILKLVKKK